MGQKKMGRKRMGSNEESNEIYETKLNFVL